MKKGLRFKKWGTATLFVLLAIASHGQQVGERFSDSDIEYEITAITAPPEVRIVRYTGTATEVDIPGTVMDNSTNTTYTVTAIGEDTDTFDHSVIRPFMGNPQRRLTRVTIPNTVAIIGLGAFSNNALTEVTIPESVTHIRRWGLSGNQYTELTIPPNVEYIGFQAFFGSQNIPIVRSDRNPPPEIDATAFDVPPGIAPRNIDLVVPFTAIQAYENSGWKDIDFVRSITAGVSIVDDDGINKVKYGIVDSRNEATVIYGSHLNPRILAEVDIDGAPYNVTTIGDNAFDTRDIQTIVIPETVRSIGARAFYSRHIFRVTVMADEPPAIDRDAFRYPYRHEMIDVFVPRDRAQAYRDAGWTGFKSLSSLEGQTHNNSGFIWEVTSVNPNEVKLIKFIGLSGESLENMFGTAGHVEIPSEIEYLPNSQNNTTYTVTSIGDGAFDAGGHNGINFWPRWIDPVTSVDIPDTVTQIGDCAFCGNELASVTIPGNVESIGDRAFEDNNLTNVEIPDSVTSIGIAAFWNNDLTSVEIPNSVTSIGEGAFRSNDLTGVTLSNSVTSIGDNAFRDNNLTEVTIPGSVESIGESAFAQNRLTEVTLSGNVADIGLYAFADNPDLSLVTVEANDPPSLHELTFSRPSRGEMDLVVPDGTTQAYLDNGWDGFRSISFGTFTVDGIEYAITFLAKVTAVGYTGTATAVTIPGTVDHGPHTYEVAAIGEAAFQGKGLASVGLPNSVTSIGERAFGDNLLAEVDIPGGVERIGSRAFYGNPDLGQVTVGADNPPALDATAFANANRHEIYLVVPTDRLQAYLDNGWGGFRSISDGGIPPRPVIGAPESVDGQEPFTVDITFDGEVADFDLCGIQVANGTVSGLTGSESAYTATIVPTSPCGGNIAIDVPANMIVGANSPSYLGAQQANVSVVDTVDPTITCPADVMANADDNGTDGCTATVDLGTPVTDDNCSVATVVAQVNGTEIDPGTYAFGAGTTTVTWIVTDDAGNTASCEQDVTVVATGNCSKSFLMDFNQGFSPNGDGIGDTLVIEGLEAYRNNVVMIYDLSQRLLFRAHYGGPGDAWDGTDRDGRVPVGSYVCVIDFNEPGLGHEAKMIYVNY